MTLEDQALIRKIVREEIEAHERRLADDFRIAMACTRWETAAFLLRAQREPGFGGQPAPELAPGAPYPNS